MKVKPSECANSFCVLPWNHRFTNIGGEAQVCCTSEEFNNSILDEKNQPILLGQNSANQSIMNSTYMKSLRLEMLSNKLPKVCERCRLTEKTGGTSRRQIENSVYKDEIPQIISSTMDDGSIPLEIHSMDFRFGNKCNLACRMCSPRASSRWISDWWDGDHAFYKMSPELEKHFRGYDWYKSDQLLEEFSKNTKFLKHLHFAGGEPLISSSMQKYLRKCIENGDAKHIEVTYNTNITTIPQTLKDLWPHFKGVKLLCSIDGFNTLNDFIRSGSQWSVIEKNLQDLEVNHQAYGVTQVILSCTVQVYNILYLAELFDYLADNFKFIHQLPHLVDLYSPEYFRTQILTTSLKKLAVERIDEIQARTVAKIQKGIIPEWQGYLLQNLASSKEFMLLEDRSFQIPNFIKATQSIDSIRKQDSRKYLPDLQELWKIN